MECRINEALVHYVEHGVGVPLVALHGAGVDHREIEAAIEAIVPDTRLRRIYPDLPGMGLSTTDGLSCNDDVVTLLGNFIDHLDAGPVMLLGHSYGAYLARGVAARRPGTVLGLALLCPVAERSRSVPGHGVVRQDADAYDELEPGLLCLANTGHGSPVPRQCCAGYGACGRGCAGAHLRRVGGRRRVERVLRADLNRGGTTRFGRRVCRRGRIARVLPARHPGCHRGRRPCADARATRTTRRVARRLARSSSTRRRVTDHAAIHQGVPELGEF
jgi:pimeloyl-ACP methyl ester carboxylesterase